MPKKFITQLEQVCRLRWRRRLLAATCWALVAVSVAALLLEGLDSALGIVDLTGRILLTTAFVFFSLLIGRRWLHAVSDDRVTPLQIAHEVERRHPTLRDVITSAWDFGQQAGEDPSLGSQSLRRAVVLRAITGVDDVDWQQFVPRQPLRQAVLAFAGLLVAISLLAWCLPEATAIGITRLLNPMSRAEWPRQHDLQFVEPPVRLAAKDDLVLQLRDTRGALPPSVTMLYRIRRQGRWHEETQLLAPTSDPLEIRRPNVQQSLQYRAIGGDHRTMPWQSLEVVAPPRVESLQLTVHPPAYTKLPAQAWDKNSPIYAGSDLELVGRTDQPVQQLMLRSASGALLAAIISPDGHSFRVEPAAWRITKSDTFTFHLTTASGLKTRWATELALDVVADKPPQVRFVEPTTDLAILPTVAVPLVIEASDELAIREVGLLYRRSDQPDEGDQQISLWHATAGATGENVTRQQRVELLWSLAPLSLEPGCVLEVHAQARDNQPAMGQPATEKSAPEQRATGQAALGQRAIGRTVRALRLSVVSEPALWRQIVEQQVRLVETLSQLLQEQRALRDMTAQWAEFPAWSTARWGNASHAALFRQRQISEGLAGSQQSVIGQLAELTQTIERNNLFRPEATERLQTAQELLQVLVDAPLTAVEQSLSEVARQSQRSLDQRALRPWLVATGEQQQQVLAGLRRVVGVLMPGNLLGRLERELVAIQTDQIALAEHCRFEVAPQILRWEETKPTEQAMLAGAVRRQRELAGRLAEAMLDVAEAAGRMADNEPRLAARFADTVTFAEKVGLQATIQAAADQLAGRRLGRAASLQRQTLDDLAGLLRRLSGQDAAGAAERFERLQAAERKLQRLRRQLAKQQAELRKLTQSQRRSELERFRRQREQLADQTEELARQLQHLRVPSAAAAAGKAASQLHRAPLDSDTTELAKQQLDRAQQQLTAERRRQQVAVARLQMARLGTKLNSLIGRQQTIQQEILRLESFREESGQQINAQAQRALQLADRQADLREEVASEAQQLTSLPVFAHLLKMASESMQRVAADLQQTELGPPTQEAADQAIRQLTQLAEAVRQEQQKLSASNRGSGDGGDGGDGGGEGKSGDTAQAQTLQLALGQLELLKALQTILHDKTQTLETEHASGQPPTQFGSELARRQQQLTELAAQLAAEPPDPREEILIPNLEQELERSPGGISLPK